MLAIPADQLKIFFGGQWRRKLCIIAPILLSKASCFFAVSMCFVHYSKYSEPLNRLKVYQKFKIIVLFFAFLIVKAINDF